MRRAWCRSCATLSGPREAVPGGTGPGAFPAMAVAAGLALLFMACAAALTPAQAQAAPSENARIAFLIESVQELKDAKFIRNGSAHDAQAAADHLRMKLREAGARVRTADDFIRLCASRSFLTGEPYRIRFADGRLVPSEVFLRDKLRELDAR